jgi:DMSO/TMAO reductase YedYZ molybdopterin-dependent catalytic subunit
VDDGGPADPVLTARSPGDEAPVGRRVFLGLLGLGVAGVVFGAKLSDVLSQAAEPFVSKDNTGLASILPVQGFRLYTVTDEFPSLPAEQYRLAVRGLVERPFTLTFDGLRALPAASLTKDFQCVTGWRVSDVRWKGVLVRDLLARAGVKPGARALRFTSFDGVYTESLTLEQAAREDVIVAYELEGKPISSEHGGPARLYVAPMYGYKSLKWLDGIEVVDRVVPGYWERAGYDVDAWVGRSNGRDDPPIG